MNASQLANGILKKDRRSLGRAVTLIESSCPKHAEIVSEMFELLVQERGKLPVHPRIAISGPPGAGKSCFIEALGMHLCDKEKKSVAVMAVDPSSSVTGGSILGDKTRMEHLSMHPSAFIRPSPTGCYLGGVAARCWEALEVFESANYDVTLVETVGVGQSETAAKDLTDLFVLLLPPAAGDDLQGIKKGIVEIADAVFITKADGAKEMLAQEALGSYRAALGVSRKCHKPTPIMAVSAETKPQSIADAWQVIDGIWKESLALGSIQKIRDQQRRTHMQWYFERALIGRAWKKLEASGDMERLQGTLSDKKMTPRAAGEEALRIVLQE